MVPITAWVTQRRRVARARRLHDYACGIFTSGANDAEPRAMRLYRRALRTLDPHGALPPDRQAQRAELRLRLRRLGFAFALYRHRVRLSVVVVVLALVVLAVPGLRRSLFPTNLAADKAWVASSVIDNAGFIDHGVMPAGDVNPDGWFHTREELYPSVTIDLGAEYALHAVKVWNRTNCCGERALALAIELSRDNATWQRVGYRRIKFDTWSRHFATTRARYVRLRVDRRSTLHLLNVEVY